MTETKSEKPEKIERDVVVMRISKVLKNRLEKLVEKRKTTLTAVTNEALEKYLESEEYIFDDVLKIVDTIPSLALNRAKIIDEMKTCPAFLCKKVIDVIKDKQVFLFEETVDTLLDRIKKIDKENLFAIFIHLTVKDEEINQVNEIMKKIAEILKDKKINVGAGMKGNDHDRVLLFVSYNKKEGDGKK